MRRVTTNAHEAYGRLVSPRLARTGDCLVFTGYLNNKGYGMVGVGGRAGRLALCHRITYEALREPIPAGLEVMHSCDTPACCNIDHLKVGTHRENMVDMTTKGRHWAKRPRALTSAT